MTAELPEPATLAELVTLHARIEPDRPALIFEDRTHTYAALDAAIEAAADAFAASGVRPGDRVALMFGNDPIFVAAYYAVARLGAVVVPINPMYRRTEIEHIVRDSKPVAVLVEGSLWPEVARDFLASSIGIVVVAHDAPTADRSQRWNDFLANASPRAAYAPEPEDLVALIYTSGTTGPSKGAMHSHGSLLANCRQGGRLPRRYLRSSDRALNALPLSHMFAMQSGLNGLFRVGGSVVLLRRFHPTGVLEQIERHRCTFLLGAPPMFTRWIAMPELRSFDLSSLRIVTCGAAPLRAAVLEEFRAATGISVSESYGLTEAGPTTHSNSAGPIDKLGSVGPPITDVEARLVDEQGHDVAAGEPGELLVRSPGLMLGYWRNSAASAETIRDGWLHTGDVAVVDADGYYTIVDRLKDMIAAGGFKVWPLEVESVLLAHPGVAEVAVVGLPDADAGERPMAFVVRVSGALVTAPEVAAFAQRSLAKYKVPVRIEFVDELPRLITGKVLRRELRERVRALVAAESATSA